MNKQFLASVAFLIPFIAFSQFTIKGKIMDPQNIENLDIYIDIGMNVNKSFSAKIENDTFTILGKVNEPINSMLMKINGGGRSSVKILLDNESTYNVDILLKDDSNLFGEDWYQIKTNSEYHNTWQKFYVINDGLFIRKSQIIDDFENKIISKKNLDDKILKLENEINQKFKDLAIKEPSNYAVPYILTGAPDLSYEYLPYYEMLDDDVKKSYWGQKLKEILDKFASKEYEYSRSTPILGSKLNSLKGRNIVGKIQNHTNESLESKLTLIDFWASWCAPCRQENVSLGVLNKKYNNEDFKIISFSLDDNLERWEKASLKDNITWENISDLDGMKSKTMKDYQIKQLPRNVLINSKGNIVAIDKFGTELAEYVRSYLGKK